MATAAQEEPQLHLLPEWEGLGYRSWRRHAATGSIAVHVLVLILLATLPRSVFEVHRHPVHYQITPLVAPSLARLTQPTPNQGKINETFNTESLRPRPRLQVPQGLPSTLRPAAPRPAPMPSLPELEPAQNLTAGPKLDLPQVAPPKLEPPPAPQIQTQERPKLALETPPGAGEPKPGQGRLSPSTSISEAMKGAIPGRGPAGGITVGDIGAGVGGIGEMANLPPSPGSARSGLELLSDPMGVDFRPYLVRVLANVRRNWFSILPESAKMGRRGKVSIQFAIDRKGGVPKLVIVSPSGADPLDRAAVAGISASTPFPPLPPDYRGSQIRLQFTFLYNVPAN